MKGLVRLMDLSPRGDKLIYWAAQYHSSARWMRPHQTNSDVEFGAYDPLTATGSDLRRRAKRHPKRKIPRYLAGPPVDGAAPRRVMGTWTAISTPPCFSALAIWPAIGHWTGGGFFASDDHIVLYESDCGLTPIANTPIPSKLRISPWDRLRAQLPPPLTLAHNPLRQLTDQQVEIELAIKSAGARFVDWTCVTPHRGILFACDGSIFRHRGTPGEITPAILRNATRLFDLSMARFTLIKAPNAAMRW